MNYDSKIAPVWQLPVAGSERTGTAYIHPKAKYHCFVSDRSLCGLYCQRTEDYDEGISTESVAILERPCCACNHCFVSWRRKFMMEFVGVDE